MKTRLTAAVIAVFAVAIPVASPAQTVFSPDAIVAGRTYSEWSARWWQWAFSIPVPNNPTLDPDGRHCHVRQTEPVFFLAGSFSGEPVIRECTVSSRRALFFPLINAECSNLEPPPFFGADEAELRACARVFLDGTSLSSLHVTIDGVDVLGLAQFRFQSPLFEFTLPGNNLLGLPGGTSGISISDGFWLMIQLAPGDHVIHFEAEITTGPGAGFTQDVTYELRVTP